MGLGVFVARAGENRVMLHQAANDGYRGVYMVCFDGPDRGKGIVVVLLVVMIMLFMFRMMMMMMIMIIIVVMMVVLMILLLFDDDF